MKRLLAIYLIATLLGGMVYTRNRLARDIEDSLENTGRVNLLCSYWYEYWQPQEVMEWYAQTVTDPLVALMPVDKGATLVYARHYAIPFSRVAADTMYVLTAYPSMLKRAGLSVERMSSYGFWGIYRVTGRGI